MQMTLRIDLVLGIAFKESYPLFILSRHWVESPKVRLHCSVAGLFIYGKS